MPVAARGTVGPAVGLWNPNREGFDPPVLHYLPTPHARASAAIVLAGCWLLVRQPLALRARHQLARPFAVRHLATVVPEAELVAVTAKVPTPHVVIHASDAAL